MKKILPLVPAVLVVLALAGCSVGSLPGTSSAIGTPSPTAAATNTKALNICSAVSVATVARLTNRPYTTSSPVHLTGLDGCNYYGANPKTLRFSLGWYRGDAGYFTALIKEYNHFPVKPIPNLGDQAEDLTMGVLVRYGDDIYLSLDGIAPKGWPYLDGNAEIEIIEALKQAR